MTFNCLNSVQIVQTFIHLDNFIEVALLQSKNRFKLPRRLVGNIHNFSGSLPGCNPSTFLTWQLTRCLIFILQDHENSIVISDLHS